MGQIIKHKYQAIWDTGASKTAISSRVADDLGLIPVNQIDVETAKGSMRANTYLVNIYLPNTVAVAGLEVSESILNGCDILVGMDIIGMEDFAVTQNSGRSVMTFQMPSTHCTDYVREIESERKPIKKERNLSDASDKVHSNPDQALPC